MKLRLFSICLGLLIIFYKPATGQVLKINGFVRTGAYTGFNKETDKIYVSSAFADMFLKTEVSGNSFKAYSQLQFRYGTEFLATVNDLRLREGYITFSGKKFDISTGQRIVKWGRADFNNPTSKITPRNLLLRAPDREEMNIGNLLAELNYFPDERIKLQIVAIPLYRSSILIIDPVPLPSYVNVDLINGLIAENSFSLGIRSDFYLSGFDVGISFFNGLDPMPGLAMNEFEINIIQGFPVPHIGILSKPYSTRVVGLDFEASSGSFGFRGEAAWSKPANVAGNSEYIPLPSIDLVAGSDWSEGAWKLSAEYYGRYNYDFVPNEAQSLIGSEPDIQLLGQLMATPGFDPGEYVREQIGSFNRLYNYQQKSNYHTFSVRIEREFSYGTITPSILSMYNIISGDLLVIPEVRYKPADGFTIAAGAEYYHGPAGSLYRITDDFMNSVYVSFRADF
ncbi:MAG TPA: hypothetical protein VK213_00285 [Bacteroidales bacterium]|nr:hypothetical protein [Bacteroidales bacterium]